ncbi:hypothetical protein OESDEN_13728 [Oesophagostomum dentatum]|uniref:Globin domain-containing protein n=1 Tax=Oesophagostomum dentatum TaxID=61180 RepID=A0A0B1SRJ6_OESDE|nr:hypothetical protein OESDEN_13728 [Oesophagostomum dentatum]
MWCHLLTVLSFRWPETIGISEYIIDVAKFFTHYPDVRKYFKGAENYAANDVAKNNVFRGVCCDVINRHVEGERHLDPALWKQFCSIWVAWLESKGVTISADQKAAWDTLSVTFNEKCQKYLAALGQPHL